MVKQQTTFFHLLLKGKTIVLAIPLALHTSPYHAAAVTNFGKRRYNTWFSDLSAIRIFSENRCMNGCNVLFAESRVEDCLELNFRYVDYQPLALLSYSAYVCWRSVRETRVKRYSRVQVSINISIPKRFQINCSIDLCYIKIAVSESLPLYS